MMDKCPNCGKKVDANWNFCVWCGTMLKRRDRFMGKALSPLQEEVDAEVSRLKKLGRI